jgi:probable F420-dependent oxidoreductase
VRLAEAVGFDSVFAVEHVVIPDNYASVYPYAPGGRLPGGPSVSFPDPLIWLTWVAAATTRLRFMTAVMILPQRNPLVLAKEVATLDYLSGGRIELGIGVGWLKEEFDALGVPFERRGKRADEYVAAMRALWAGDAASFAGEFVNFDKVNCNPKPVAKSVPIVVGGHSEAAARRAGRLGDGFFPSIGAQVDTMPLLDVVRRSAEQAGRDPAKVELILGCPGALPNSGSDPRAAVEERIARGAGRLALPVTAFMPDLETTLARFGEEIIKPYANA